MSNTLTEAKKAEIGQELAEVLQLHKVHGYEPPRYKTVWGQKTALGIYNTVERILAREEVCDEG